MCEFCVKHGEGKKWYLNVKNYSDDLLSDIARKKRTENIFYWIDQSYKRYYGMLKMLPVSVPIVGRSVGAIIKRFFIYRHWGQVIPIEDVEKILNFTNSITRIPCVCRMSVTGKERRVCFLVSINPAKTEIANVVDRSFFGGPDVAKFEKVGKAEALNVFKKSELCGMVHTVWTFKAPFTGALCNCDASTGCIAMKMYDKVAPVIFRSEYIAEVNAERCVGCKECLKLCQFGAISFDKKTGKIKIDIKRCYGCGICRSVCKQNAIKLIDRQRIPAVAELW